MITKDSIELLKNHFKSQVYSKNVEIIYCGVSSVRDPDKTDYVAEIFELSEEYKGKKLHVTARIDVEMGINLNIIGNELTAYIVGMQLEKGPLDEEEKLKKEKKEKKMEKLKHIEKEKPINCADCGKEIPNPSKRAYTRNVDRKNKKICMSCNFRVTDPIQVAMLELLGDILYELRYLNGRKTDE
jgi:hypothetical protein